ncbi:MULTISPECIES: helix-turn-helix domain-containing protein [Massilia]|uniref:helix-turn-helix domain-containing protein n=1 Tax=Massilia TaxID=149698 RepID=UPI0006BB780E|nr:MULTISPECIES: helix-turn-helix transcriptional regulator [Massilia]CUI04711.1 Predicted transcriptional regulator [Janthinobacterium sp. CG23_2]MCY0911664.1 helix-turn-helix transcriptional regulator [Massilia sp. H27-R4]MDM5181188.1 helix-turn-helix transcriptional regulator [Massilia sp. DJPM01]MDQ1924309.1 helix-turn-helix transcriptional regulator [Massilia sp. CCM 9206]CUU28497.1 Predicted transcriptional regulator [Janthinobacterium sp. CG23_2]
MPHAITLVDTLKRLLKGRGITYGDLAGRIGMSEASVKRMFSQKNFTLQRLDEILTATGIEFDELSAAQSAPTLISHLTLAQEREIIGDPRLLVVAVSAMNHIGFDDIVRFYDMTEAEVTKYLLRLDRIGFLELLPNNRVKLLIARTFGWIANGPIQGYFRHEAAADYLNSRFDGEDEVMRLVNVMLSKQSGAALLERLKQVAAEFAQQHQHETRLPLDQRHAISFIVAARPWVPQAFKALLRQG